MLFAVSPYHITTREPAALAAFLLARGVVTLLPAPGGSGGDSTAGGNGSRRDRAREAAVSVPRYLEFMESWRWTVPLWEAGVVAAGLGGEDAVGDVRAVCESIEGDERFSRLRVFSKPELWETEEGYLEAVARDVLKGGPDPAITVPLAAGMDRFAARHGLVVARSAAISVVQKAEERLGRRVFAVAAPVLLQASAERLVAARVMLEAELDDMRGAMEDVAALEATAANGEMDEAMSALAQAARAYAAAFEESREALLKVEDEDELHVVAGMVSLTGMVLPCDAVLRSSMTALGAISPVLGPAPARATNLPMAVDAMAGAPFLSVVVKVLGRAGQ